MICFAENSQQDGAVQLPVDALIVKMGMKKPAGTGQLRISIVKTNLKDLQHHKVLPELPFFHVLPLIEILVPLILRIIICKSPGFVGQGPFNVNHALDHILIGLLREFAEVFGICDNECNYQRVDQRIEEPYLFESKFHCTVIPVHEYVEGTK